MKQIRLHYIRLKNFMGFTDKTFNFDGENVKIYGDNGSGKTTIKSGYLWLFFGKNDEGKTQFDAKPFDENGIPLSKVDVEVEGLISVNGKKVKLRRVMSEIWNTKRGTDIEVYKGNETHYWIDDVPQDGKAAYDEYIDSLVSENVFKLVSDPLHFSSKLEWEQQRDFLTNMCGSIDDDQIASSHDHLKSVIDILDGKSADDFKKMIKSQISTCKKDKKAKPIQIKEADRNRVELPDESLDELKSRLSILTENKEGIESSVSDINVRNQSVNDSYNTLNFKKSQLSSLESQLRTSHYESRVQLTNEKSNLDTQILTHKNSIESYESQKLTKLNIIAEKEQEIKNIEVELPKLREDFVALKSKKFQEPDHNDFKCTTCNQELPTENIEIKINELRTNFNNKKQKDLSDLNSYGKKRKSSIEVIKEQIKKLSDEIALFDPKIKECQEFIIKLEKELKVKVDLLNKPVADIDFSRFPEWVNMHNDIISFEKGIGQGEDTSALIQKLNEINDEMGIVKKKINLYESNSKVDIRIQEIKDEEKVLSDEIMRLEKEQLIVEQFVIAKNKAIEEQINKHFNFVEFRLFKDQINGGIKDVCDIFIPCNDKLVRYGVANTASKIHAGMDIIKTISNHYGISVPIIVDNNESIVSAFDSVSQIIGLYVDGNHKDLLIKKEGTTNIIENHVSPVENVEETVKDSETTEGTFDLLNPSNVEGCEF